MHPFRASIATDAYWRDAAARCASELGADAEGQLGFVYVTTALETNLSDIVADLRQRTAIEHWVGTVGEGVCSSAREDYDGPALAVLATDLRAEQFRVLPGFRGEVTTTLEQTAHWRAEMGGRFGILHCDPRNPATPGMVAELADGLNGGFLVGGLSSSQGSHPQFADALTHGGVSGVLLAESVAVAAGLTQGCTLISGQHVVTDAQGNLIVTLDGRPALDVLKEDVGELLARDIARIAGYIFAALPVKSSDTADYLVRNLVGIDPANGLLAIGDRVQTGDLLCFARRDGQSAREDMLRMLRDLGQRVQGAPVKGALYISCLGRGRHLFGSESEELRLIHDEFGDIPIAGFFANGEISHDRLYGYTGVLTLFL